MIKKTLFILTLGFSFQGQINARAVLPTDSIKQTHLLHQEEILKPLEPTLLPNEVAYSNWKSNWFFNVSGGTSAFIGSPLGCEDLFGRMKPTLAISAGKWFSPTVGSRVSFQGFQFKDSQSQTCDYQSLHGDLRCFPELKQSMSKRELRVVSAFRFSMLWGNLRLKYYIQKGKI